MPKQRLPAIANRAVWEKVTKGRAGVRWDNVVDTVWKEVPGRRKPRRHTVHWEDWGFKTEVKERIEMSESLALKRRWKGEHLEIYTRLRQQIVIKIYSHRPMDHAKTLNLQYRVGDLDQKDANSRGEEDAQICFCGKPKASRTRIVGECELCKEERAVLEEEMRKTDEYDMNKYSTLDTKEKTIAILGARL